MLVRRERTEDAGAVARVHTRAFERPDDGGNPVEVALVDELRRSTAWLPRLSLVAIASDEVVGHVVCTRAGVGAAHRPVLGLGPIGVLPECQGRGVGSALLHAVLAAADACDEPLVGVLGEPAFYRRFGFVRAADHRITAPDPAWGDFFQVRLLTSATPQLRGPFRYAAPFARV